MPAKLEIQDLGIGRLQKDLAELAQQHITLGWQGHTGAAPHPENPDESNAQIAAWMEYGTTKMPARPALRRTFSVNKDKFAALARTAISDLIDQRAASAVEAAEKVADEALFQLRKILDAARSWAEPLAPRTVKKKGHGQPWIDTGTLRDKASWAIRAGDTIVRQGGET